MKTVILAYIRTPLLLAGHAWIMFFFSLFSAYGFLPYAQKLYNGDYQFVGFLLHRSLVVMFLLAALMAVLSILTQLHVQLFKIERPFLQRAINIGKCIVAALPVVLLGSISAFLLLVGRYLGLSLN